MIEQQRQKQIEQGYEPCFATRIVFDGKDDNCFKCSLNSDCNTMFAMEKIEQIIPTKKKKKAK